MTIYLDRLGTGDIAPLVNKLQSIGETEFLGSPGTTYQLASTLGLGTGVTLDLRGGILNATHVSTATSVLMGERSQMCNGTYLGMDVAGTVPPPNNAITDNRGFSLAGDLSQIHHMTISGRITPIVVDQADDVRVFNVSATGLANVVAEWNSHTVVGCYQSNRAHISDIVGVDFGSVVAVTGGDDCNIQRITGRETVTFNNRDNCVYVSSGNRPTVRDVYGDAAFDNAVKVRASLATIENVRASSLCNIGVSYVATNADQGDGYAANGSRIANVKADGCVQGAVNFRADIGNNFAHRGIVIDGVWSSGTNPIAGRAVVWGWADDVTISNINCTDIDGHVVRLVGETDANTVARGSRIVISGVNVDDATTGNVNDSLFHLENLTDITIRDVFHVGGGPTDLLELINVQGGSFWNMTSSTGRINEDAACSDNQFCDIRSTGTDSFLGSAHRSCGSSSTDPATSATGSFTGDGVATQFGPVNHALNTSTPSVEVFVAGVLISDGWSATITDADNLTVDFGTAPANTAAITVKVST